MGTSSEYLERVRPRLEQAGFEWTGETRSGSRTFRAVARKSGFELTKLGVAEVFFVFADFERLDTASLRTFVGDAFQHAVANRKVRLPRGVFASVFVYAVAIAAQVDEDTVRTVRSETPKKHWSAAEIPVIHDSGSGRTHSFEKTPMWGAAYWRGFRRQIETLLAP